MLRKPRPIKMLQDRNRLGSNGSFTWSQCLLMLPHFPGWSVRGEQVAKVGMTRGKKGCCWLL